MRVAKTARHQLPSGELCRATAIRFPQSALRLPCIGMGHEDLGRVDH
jgi:hypothetical protein